MRIRSLRWSWLVTLMFAGCPVIPAQIPQADTAREQQAIQSTIDAFKTDDIERIVKKIQYPLARRYPLPPVANAQDLRQRHTEIFDLKLSKLISGSNAKTDWSPMGWRGYMLHDGLVWAGENGLITAINYESQKEQSIRAALIEADRKTLHESLRSFDKPVLKWDTRNHRLRIDEVGEHYRLVLWPVGLQFKDKPELVIEQGSLTYDGSGGNHHYSFTLGKKIYVCDVEVVGGEDRRHIGSFEIRLDGKTLPGEEALKSY